MRPRVQKITLCIGALILTLSCSSCQVAREAQDLPQENTESTAPQADPRENGAGKLVYLKVENAAASSFDDTPDWAPKPDAMAPVDRDILTRWSSKMGFDNEWIYFDFGRPKTLSRIVIKWEQAHAVDYEILISQDARSWKRLALIKGGDGGTDEIKFSAIKARYVKIINLKRNNPQWGFSIWEFEIYGPKNLNPDEKTEKADFLGLEEKKKEFEEILAKLKATVEPLTLEEFHKGVVYTSWSDSELGTIASDLTLVHLYMLGARHIAIMAPAYQKAVDSEEIVTHDFPGGDTPTEESIVHAIKSCHSLGMKVMLKPHLDCLDGTPRVDIIASDAWFKNYKRMILRYAKIAEENDVEIFAVGTELENTTFSKWEAEWRDVIASVKEIYNGYLTYSANWTEYEDVPFWDMMDFIGIDAYFPLTKKNDPTKEELEKAWEGIAGRIGTWLKDSNLDKGVIFTELGYVSSDGTNTEPWATQTNPEDQFEQADCLDAALEVLSKRIWFRGMYLWQYFAQERWSPLGYPVRGKEAEKVLKKWYEKL